MAILRGFPSSNRIMSLHCCIGIAFHDRKITIKEVQIPQSKSYAIQMIEEWEKDQEWKTQE